MNGVVSKPFPIKSGVRQGCPLSPLAFICTIESLLKSIQKEKICKGFSVPGGGGRVVKTMAYMDDVVVVGSSQREVDRICLVTDLYCMASKMRVNWSKSGLCNLGTEICLKSDKLEIKKEIQILGIIFDKTLKGKTVL